MFIATRRMPDDLMLLGSIAARLGSAVIEMPATVAVAAAEAGALEFALEGELLPQPTTTIDTAPTMAIDMIAAIEPFALKRDCLITPPPAV
jgi:hypothetical protein